MRWKASNLRMASLSARRRDPTLSFFPDGGDLTLADSTLDIERFGMQTVKFNVSD